MTHPELEEAAKAAGFALVPLDRLLLVTGGRYFATDNAGRVNLPIDHIRRSVANELAQQIAPALRLNERSDGYRMRIYQASVQFVLPLPAAELAELDPAARADLDAELALANRR